MRAPVTAACVQVEPAIFDRAAHDRPRRRAHRGGSGRRRRARRLPGDVHSRLPVLRVGEGARRLGRARSEGGVRVAPPRVARAPRAGRRPARRDRPGARRVARDRRQRGRPGAARDALQLASLLLAGGRAGAPSPQARADEPRAARLGTGRRPRPPRDRDADRPARRADLLGELHAAGAVLALRVGHRDLHRLDRGRRRLVAGDAAAHRARVPLVRRRALPLPARELVSRRLPARIAARGSRHPRPRRLARFSARTAATSPARSTTRRGSSTPSSIRTCCSSHASASTRPATTTGRTCSA